MKNIPLIIFSLAFFWATDVYAAATMLRMNRLDNNDLSQIFITFDQVPKYSHEISGKRINLIFAETVKDANFRLLTTDGRIVKYLINTHDTSTILSIFLRYPPQKVHLAAAAANQLALEIVIGNEYSTTYQDFSQKLQGLTVLRDSRTAYTSPLHNSAYAPNWKSFLKQYQPEITLDIPVHYTLPDFPVLTQFPNNTVSEKILNLLSKNPTQGQKNATPWTTLQQNLLAQINTTPNPNEKKLLALTYGEALLRNGDWIDAYKQFYLLAETYPEELIGFWAKYLIIYTTARYNDPFLALAEATEFATSIPQNSTLAAYLHLLRIETGLATKNLKKVQELLNRKEIPIPTEIYPFIEMRGADYLYAADKYIPAHITYQSIPETLLHKSPHSLAGNCTSLFKLKKYHQAHQCYQQLIPQVKDSQNRALAAYLAAITTIKTDTKTKDRSPLFTSIEDTYQGTKGSFRAAIRKNDLKFCNDPKWGEKATVYYQALAKHAPWKDIREECYLKEAVVWYLLGNSEKALPVLQKLRREFRTGPLKQETTALLLTILPGELQRLVDQKHYIKALTLARQYKNFFEKEWLSKDIFPSIAKAFSNSYLDHEAEKVYLYLYNIADEDKKEDYFLMLVQAIFNQGKYYMVDDYASQYAYLYPTGKHRTEILHLRLNALTFLGKNDKVTELLSNISPKDQKGILFAASRAYTANEFAKAAKLLKSIAQERLGNQELLMLAEASFQNKDIPQAKEIFATLIEKKFHAEQALYRLAEIAEAEGDLEASRDYLKKITVTNTNSPWTRYADKTLKIMDINKAIDATINNP